LEAIKGRWGDYRRALRRHEKSHYDRLFEYADAHADAAGYLNTDDPMDPVLLSMLLEHQKRLAEQRNRIDQLEAELDRRNRETDEPATR
jgi:predicted secreted Zn-dependent protease